MALAAQPLPPIPGVRIPGLSSIPMLHGAEKAASTYKRGAFLIDDDAGAITEATSPIDGSAVTKRCFGMANHDAVGVALADIAFTWLLAQVQFEISLMELTAGNHTLVQADMFKVYPITKATSYWYLNADAVSDTGGGLVVGFKDPIGTVNGRVYAVLTSTARGGANAASGVF